MLKTILNWLKVKDSKFNDGYGYAKRVLADRHGAQKDQEAYDSLFCDVYSDIFVCSFKLGIRKALCEFEQEQRNEQK